MSLVDIETFRAYVNSSRLDVSDIAMMNDALAAAEGWIAAWCGRSFVVAGASSIRTFVAPIYGDTLEVDDFTTLTSVSVDGSTLSASNYQVEPVGGVSRYGIDGPSWRIRYFSTWPQPSWPGKITVSVNAAWGWPSIPPQVTEACKIAAKDILANQSVSFGIAAFTEYAGIRARENPQVTNLLRPFRRLSVLGIG